MKIGATNRIRVRATGPPDSWLFVFTAVAAIDYSAIWWVRFGCVMAVSESDDQLVLAHRNRTSG
jgi:hypothetical protein